MAVYFRPLAISPTLPIIPYDSKNSLQELTQECNISRIKTNFCLQEQQEQCIAQLTALGLSTAGDSKLPLQPGAKVMGRLCLYEMRSRENTRS